MKVILNEDVVNLGEEGDVKVVKDGYARNFLIPRGYAVPFTKGNEKVFEARKDIIEKKKEEKRKAAMSEKDKIESLEVSIPMPAGENGRLFGSVTNALISDILAQNGIQIERKKIELAEHNIKTVGKFSAKIKLYEHQTAELSFNIVSDKEAGKKIEEARKEAGEAVPEEPVKEEKVEASEDVQPEEPSDTEVPVAEETAETEEETEE